MQQIGFLVAVEDCVPLACGICVENVFLHGPISIKASSMRITDDLLTFPSFHEQKE